MPHVSCDRSSATFRRPLAATDSMTTMSGPSPDGPASASLPASLQFYLHGTDEIDVNCTAPDVNATTNTNGHALLGCEL